MNLKLAQANLEASVKEAGFGWTVEVEQGDDYTVRLGKGSRMLVKKNVSRGVLEDEGSPFRDRLVEDARHQLEA